MEITKDSVMPEQMPVVQAIDSEQLQKFTQILQKYKAAKSRTEQRIVAAENWWKLRNAREEELNTMVHWDGFRSQSAWLHNVIANKHADIMDSYPQPVILPREKADKQEAKMLSDIIPCIMEMVHFEETYSDVSYQKLKGGTGVYKIVWNKSLLNGLGDIDIKRGNLLNLYWEPGITDIQSSRYLFDTELVDNELLEEQYPQCKDKLKGNAFLSTRFLYDDTVSTDGKSTVIGVYYHKGGKLHYLKYVADVILESTENDPTLASTGLYDHGKYPYVFDPLYPIEGSPCGYGIVDLCRNPQEEIDLLRTAIVRNAMSGATPRHFMRADGSINEQEYLDITKPLVHVNGNLGEDSIRAIPHVGLEGNYLGFLQETISELRETSGNTEAATGSGASGVTSASGLAALQEASGKLSRDNNRATYRAYGKIIEIVVELIRQFYDIPRQFRIIGQNGAEQFVQYSNEGIMPQDQGMAFGVDMGMRLPVFDIKIAAEKKNAYTTLSQNELALQFFQAGVFNPQLVDQVVMLLEMMSFEGKEELLQRVSEAGTMAQKYQLLIQYAAALAAKYKDQNALMQLQQIAGVGQQTMGAMPNSEGVPDEMPAAAKESKVTAKAREATAERTQVK